MSTVCPTDSVHYKIQSPHSKNEHQGCQENDVRVGPLLVLPTNIHCICLNRSAENIHCIALTVRTKSIAIENVRLGPLLVLPTNIHYMCLNHSAEIYTVSPQQFERKHCTGRVVQKSSRQLLVGRLCMPYSAHSTQRFGVRMPEFTTD